ncbi:MAG: hypothetical protein LBE11_07920 [Prevotellaceae bacterium]|jgi:hypothetical protein|nr:hypothetical protein [Prevotellaceae bacterium]
MKTLDLNAYGVKEVSVSEMRKIEGGIWWRFFIDPFHIHFNPIGDRVTV